MRKLFDLKRSPHENWMAHHEPSLLAGKTVKVRHGRLAGRDFYVEDWIDRAPGINVEWANSDVLSSNAIFMLFLRKEIEHLPSDNNVLYGRIGSWPYAVHLSEL